MLTIRRRLGTEDEGFTLVEVIVGMMIFAFIITSTTGLIAASLRGLLQGRLDTLGKDLSQEGMEKVRNLPFFVSATVANGSPDLFDRYYPSTSMATTSATASGFVANGSTLRDTVNGDPTTGPFYRTVLSPISTDPKYSRFSQRITVQLLDDSGNVMTSPSFNAASTSTDGKQPSSIVAVTVTTLWKTAQGKAARYSLYTRVADSDIRQPIVTLQARLAALRVSGVLSGSRELQVEAGSVNLDGSLSSSTVASGTAQGAFAAIANADRVDGAKDSVSAPPTTTRASTSATSQSLNDNGNAVGQLSNTRVDGLGASVDNGQPSSGSSASPVTAHLFGGGFGNYALTADTAADTSTRLRLAPGTPVLRLLASSCGGSCDAVKGTGYLTSVGGGSHSAMAGLGVTTTGTFELLPTTFAPDGVVQFTFPSASLTCASAATASPAASVSATYSSQLRYWTPAGYSGWINLGISSTSSATATDPLAAIPLGTTQVGVDSTGQPLYLGDYLQAWGSLTKAALTSATKVGTGGTTSSVTLPGFLSVATVPLRSDPDSTFAVQMAASSCTAGDVR